MNRKKRFLLTILVLVLAVSILASFVSCKRETGPAGGNTDEDVIITNGSFASVNSETFPKVPSGWTASAGSTSSSSASLLPPLRAKISFRASSTPKRTYLETTLRSGKSIDRKIRSRRTTTTLRIPTFL